MNLNTPTIKQFEFFIRTKDEFTKKLDRVQFAKDVAEDENSAGEKYGLALFQFMLDKMLESKDDEIRVDLPRHLMFLGYKRTVEALISCFIDAKTSNG